MTPPTPVPAAPLPLRLWPGVALAALLVVFRFVLPLFADDMLPVAFLGATACGVLIAVWWLLFSRAPWPERLGAPVLAVVLLAAAWPMIHPSIRGGAMGYMLPFLAVPTVAFALVVAALVSRRWTIRGRRLALALALGMACGAFTLVRTEGMSSTEPTLLHWRWTPTPEELLLAQAKSAPPAKPTGAAPAATPSVASAHWPGFRGPTRDSIVRGARIETNWSATPPTELWRRPVGPGWSSFAVSAGLVYTQEQRGDHEVVACYQLGSGAPVWLHQDATRFYESNAGAGPRGTPTVHHGRVYTLGATGIVNALDARTGAVVWTRQAATDTKGKIPEWGLSSSPLVVGDRVIVAVSGTLAAYELATGAPRWTGPTGGGSYSSPHLFEADGVAQILLMSDSGATGFDPHEGKPLWQHAWKGFAIVQPAPITAGAVLLSTGDTAGVRRIEVSQQAGAWTVTERWTSRRLKPYFNDYVLHRGHAFGFDSGGLACIDLADGERKWKGGRYGRGQLILLPEQDVLLVLSEQGEVALVAAKVEGFAELARFKALAGKTWNHPVLAGDVLLVRNDQEMAAYRLR